MKQISLNQLLVVMLFTIGSMTHLNGQTTAEDFIREAESALADERLTDAASAHSSAGQKHLESGEYEKAAEQFEKAAELFEEDGREAQSNAERTNAASSAQSAAAEESEKGRHDKAAELYERATQNYEKAGRNAMAEGARQNAEYERSLGEDDEPDQPQDQDTEANQDQTEMNCRYRKFAVSAHVRMSQFQPQSHLFDQVTQDLKEMGEIFSLEDGTMMFTEGMTAFQAQSTRATTFGISVLNRLSPSLSVRGSLQFGRQDVVGETTMLAFRESGSAEGLVSMPARLRGSGKRMLMGAFVHYHPDRKRTFSFEPFVGAGFQRVQLNEFSLEGPYGKMMTMESDVNATSYFAEGGANFSFQFSPGAEIMVAPSLMLRAEGVTPGIRTGLRIPFGTLKDHGREPEGNEENWRPAEIDDEVIEIADRDEDQKYCECGSVKGKWTIQKGKYDAQNRRINLELGATSQAFETAVDGKVTTIRFDQNAMEEGEIQMMTLELDEKDATCDCVEYDDKLIELLKEVERIETLKSQPNEKINQKIDDAKEKLIKERDKAWADVVKYQGYIDQHGETESRRERLEEAQAEAQRIEDQLDELASIRADYSRLDQYADEDVELPDYLKSVFRKYKSEIYKDFEDAREDFEKAKKKRIESFCPSEEIKITMVGNSAIQGSVPQMNVRTTEWNAQSKTWSSGIVKEDGKALVADVTVTYDCVGDDCEKENCQKTFRIVIEKEE